MAIRIGKVSRELNVGASTLVEFLHKKGFQDVTEDLNQKLTDEQYNMLIEGFSDDKSLKDAAAKFLQERRLRSGSDDVETETKSESAEEAAPVPEVEEEHVEAKPEPVPEPVISEEPEEPSIQIKTVGKIDLDNAGKSNSKKAEDKSVEEKHKPARKEKRAEEKAAVKEKLAVED